jgi:uncharacterized protein
VFLKEVVMRTKIKLVLIAFFVFSFVSVNESQAGKKEKKHFEDDGISKKSGCFPCFGGLFRGSKKKIDHMGEYDGNLPSYKPPIVQPDIDYQQIVINDPLVSSQTIFNNTLFKTHKCALDCQQKVFVLSLDGGGIRGVILARILMHVAQLMNVPIDQLFNLMAGTSTGGLIALALSMPDVKNTELSRFKPEEILEQYLTKKEDIFKKRSIIYLPGILESKYNTKGIETFCKETFTEDMRLSQLLVPTFVTTFNDTKNKEEIFGSHSAFLGDAKNKRIWTAGRITSAAPFYFTSVKEDGDIYRDGGLSSNNPSRIALDEILRLFPGKTYKDIIVVSIGTGEHKGEIPKINLNLPDIQKIIKQFEEGQLASVDRTMEYALKENYIRIQTELPCDPKTDDIHEEYIASLLQCAEETIAKNEAQFERLKSLWIAQHQQVGAYKHTSSYDDWRKIQSDIMNAENMQSADLTQIQEFFYRNQNEY